MNENEISNPNSSSSSSSSLKIITYLSLVVTLFDLLFMIVNTLMVCILNKERNKIIKLTNDDQIDNLLLNYQKNNNTNKQTFQNQNTNNENINDNTMLPMINTNDK